jgi:hypothetical protein
MHTACCLTTVWYSESKPVQIRGGATRTDGRTRATWPNSSLIPLCGVDWCASSSHDMRLEKNQIRAKYKNTKCIN